MTGFSTSSSFFLPTIRLQIPFSSLDIPGENGHIAPGLNNSIAMVYFTSGSKSRQLNLRENVTGIWQDETQIASSLDPGISLSIPELAIGLDASIQVVYRYSNNSLYYITRNASSTQWHTVISNHGSNFSSALQFELDNFNGGHIAYSEVPNPLNPNSEIIRYLFPAYTRTDSRISNYTLLNATYFNCTTLEGLPVQGNFTEISEIDNSYDMTEWSTARNVVNPTFAATLFERNPIFCLDSNRSAHFLFEGGWNHPTLVKDLYYSQYKLTWHITPRNFTESSSDQLMFNTTYELENGTVYNAICLLNSTSLIDIDRIIANTTGFFTGPTRITNITPLDRILSPQITIDSSNVIHMAWLQNNNNTSWQLRYTSFSSAFPQSLPVIRNISVQRSLQGNQIHMLVDDQQQLHFLLRTQSTQTSGFYDTDLIYLRYKNGTLQEETVIPTPYLLSTTDFNLDPTTHIPSIGICTKANLYDNYRVTLITSKQGHFGWIFDTGVSIAGEGARLTGSKSKGVSNDTYKLEIVPAKRCHMILNLSNPFPILQSISIRAEFISSSTVNLLSGQNPQMYYVLSPSEQVFLSWEFQLPVFVPLSQNNRGTYGIQLTHDAYKLAEFLFEVEINTILQDSFFITGFVALIAAFIFIYYKFTKIRAQFF